ncbi:MAG: hypothetical protein J07AB43_02750 [Candidatus Nanosalina sp. J07AB43]|nr:MAG: hypothetical protein J07AB43_02750 [Candidatus Nanosalina sp. J07AB43]
MSIFETQVKDVAERSDSNPLELVSRFTYVNSDDVESNTATVTASAGEVVIIEGGDLADADTINVELAEEAPPNSKVIVNGVGGGSHTISVSSPGDPGIEGTTDPGTEASITYLSDGSDYYEI